MCCDNTREGRRLARHLFKDRARIRAWKVLDDSGQSSARGFPYRPGTHKVDVKRYRKDRPRGIHVYWAPGGYLPSPYCFVPVWVHRDDLIAADVEQGVFRKVRIRKKDWEQDFERREYTWHKEKFWALKEERPSREVEMRMDLIRHQAALCQT